MEKNSWSLALKKKRSKLGPTRYMFVLPGATVDGNQKSEINSPVEVGSLSHYLQGFSNHPRWLYSRTSGCHQQYVGKIPRSGRCTLGDRTLRAKDLIVFQLHKVACWLQVVQVPGYVYKYIIVLKNMYTCIHVCFYVYLHLYIHVKMCVYIYTYVYVCISCICLSCTSDSSPCFHHHLGEYVWITFSIRIQRSQI